MVPRLEHIGVAVLAALHVAAEMKQPQAAEPACTNWRGLGRHSLQRRGQIAR